MMQTEIFKCYMVMPVVIFPDVDRLRLSIVSRYYIEHLPLYFLGCAHEEKCLSNSADLASPTDEK